MFLKMLKSLSLIIPFICIALLLFGGFTASPPSTAAQSGGNPRLCFTVLDGENQLMYKDRFDGIETAVSAPFGISANSLEAIAMNLDNSFLYVVDDPVPNVHTDNGQLGYLADFMTPGGGDFVFIGEITPGDNRILGTQTLDDIDSLAFDAQTNILWGIKQDTNNNLLFQIDTTTGDHISDIFGRGFDYVRVDLGIDTAAQTIRQCGGGTIACGTSCPNSIDDLAIDIKNSRFYAIANANTGTSNDFMIRIAVNGASPADSRGFDPTQGTVEACATGIIQLEDPPGTFTNMSDMEGLGISNQDGTYYGSTGEETVAPLSRHTMYRVDPETARAYYLVDGNPTAGIWTGQDPEGITCMTAGSNVITGTVYEDADPTDNETFKPGAGDEPQEDVTVELYLDNNNNGSVNAGDTLIQTQLTGLNPNDPTNDGFYSFTVGTTGSFAVRILPGTLPPGVTMTTDNSEESDFPTWGNLDPDNDYGFNLQTGFDLSITKDDGVTTYTPGGTLTYNIIVTNLGPSDAVGATVTDTFPPQFTSVSWTCAPSAGAICTAGPVQGNISDTVDIPANGLLTYTVTAQIDPNATGAIINTAGVDHPDDRDPNNNRDDDRDSPPDQPGQPTYDLTITKQVNPTSALPGDVVTWAIAVTNTGSAPLTNVTVTDPVDPNFFSEIMSATTSKGTVFMAGLNVTFNIGDLAVGESVTMTLVTRIRDGITSGSSINTATATASEIPGIRQASATVTVGVASLPATGYPPSAVEPESGPRYWLFGVVLILGIMGVFVWRRLRWS